MKFMPKGIGKLLPNLEGIQISKAKLASIDIQDLKPFKNVIKLYLHSNELEVLDTNLFEFNVELRIVHLARNKLKFIGMNILEPLPKLEKAYFDNNPCINLQAASPHSLAHLKAQINEKCQLTNE